MDKGFDVEHGNERRSGRWDGRFAFGIGRSTKEIAKTLGTMSIRFIQRRSRFALVESSATYHTSSAGACMSAQKFDSRAKEDEEVEKERWSSSSVSSDYDESSSSSSTFRLLAVVLCVSANRLGQTNHMLDPSVDVDWRSKRMTGAFHYSYRNDVLVGRKNSRRMSAREINDLFDRLGCRLWLWGTRSRMGGEGEKKKKEEKNKRMDRLDHGIGTMRRERGKASFLLLYGLRYSWWLLRDK